MKKLINFFLLILILGIMATVVGQEAYVFLGTPAQKTSEKRFFDVEHGANLKTIATRLEEQGLVRNATYFVLLTRFSSMQNRLQAGRFSLDTAWKPEQVLKELVSGQPVLDKVTLREGLTWWQAGKALENAGFVRFEDFKKLIHDPEFLRFHGIPFANAEGFLMPDTYLLKKPEKPDYDSTKVTVSRLIDTFWRRTAHLWGDSKPDAKQLRYILTLASIVEKETAVADERPRVAGVYKNRLDKNIALYADPTIIYGLGERFDGNLRRSHLEDAANPYNTYRHAGLPPGPICSPGKASLEAAVRPEKHDYLYFVAITDGGRHAFSRTLTEHNNAVKDYLQNRKKAAATPQDLPVEQTGAGTIVPQTSGTGTETSVPPTPESPEKTQPAASAPTKKDSKVPAATSVTPASEATQSPKFETRPAPLAHPEKSSSLRVPVQQQSAPAAADSQQPEADNLRLTLPQQQPDVSTTPQTP